MPTGRQPSPAAAELVQRFEGFRRRAARLPNGGWTVGYGHTVSAREGLEIAEADARDLLTWDLRRTAAAVDAHLYAPAGQNQFDALVAFAFNVGPEAFRGSAVLRRFNEGLPLQAAAALEAWRRAEWDGEPQVIDALVRRRAAEKLLFLTPEDGFLPVPGAVLPPRVDPAVRVSAEPALDLVASLDGDAASVRSVESADPQPASGRGVQPAAAAAAEQVTARLRALFPERTAEPSIGGTGRGLSVDGTPPDATPMQDAENAPEASPFPADGSAPEAAPGALADADAEIDSALSLAPPSPGFDAAASADEAAEAELVSIPVETGPSSGPDAASPQTAPSAPLPLAPVPDEPVEPRASGMAAVTRRWPYLFLFVGGAFLFGAGVHALQQRDTPAAFGWMFGLAGVACMLTAAYALFRRGDEEA